MFDCPHCGETIQDDRARRCPSCGSDDETGWNPDVDYHSVELPESDAEPTPSGWGTDRGRRLLICGIALALGVITLPRASTNEIGGLVALFLIVAGAYGLWSTLRADEPE